MTDRLAMGGAFGSMLSGYQPLIHRALGIASGSQMLSEELRLALN